ncbi:hypothetical protein J6590_064209 [Homalodisca vitripennis]|nr:hypothetical protein J6590_064209 [Homalodisca vitripennis]
MVLVPDEIEEVVVAGTRATRSTLMRRISLQSVGKSSCTFTGSAASLSSCDEVGNNCAISIISANLVYKRPPAPYRFPRHLFQYIGGSVSLFQ